MTNTFSWFFPLVNCCNSSTILATALQVAPSKIQY
jgi:hypothetical protein